MVIDRRTILSGGLATVIVGTAHAQPPAGILQLSMHPALARFYLRAPSRFDNDGRAGLNVGNYNTIEEQRHGAEWVLYGRVCNRPEWVAIGWKILDYGISKQQPDGGFGAQGYLHSNALFTEALARASLIDPAGCRLEHRRALVSAARWIMTPTSTDIAINRPFTHRRYILAAALGQAAAVANIPDAENAAYRWVREGLSLQRPNGMNPESGGFDVSYQLVGPLHACRLLPVCGDDQIRSALKRMISKAVAWDASRIATDGQINVTGSSRVGHETYGGELKTVNVYDAYQALVYSAELVDPACLEIARRIGQPKGWWPI